MTTEPRPQRPQLDRHSVVTGAIVTVIISLPSARIGRALSANELSNLSILFAVLVLLGPLVGGALAARGHPASSLVHGAAAAALGWAVTVGVTITGRLIVGHGVPILSSLLVGCMFVPLGIFGGYFTFRRHLRKTTAQ
jgi:hypothetical protein